MKDSLKLGGILFLITAICCGLLGFVSQTTTPIISANQRASQDEAMKQLIVGAKEFTEVKKVESENIKELYMAKADDKVLGTVAKLMPSGYGGPITLLVGLDTEGTVKGIKILSMTETPGLGANADSKSFLDQFLKKLPPLKVVKTSPKDDEIEAITGATITSTAITKGVNEAAKYVADHKEQLQNSSEMEGK